MYSFRTRGFTLVELMTVIAILAVLIAIAFPSFQGSMRSNRVATASNQMSALVSYARSEAIRSKSLVQLCTSIDGSSCGGDWNDGWMVWVDRNDSGVLNPDEVLRYVEAPQNIVVAESASQTTVNFDARGRVRDNSSRSIELQPSECPIGVDLVRTFTLSSSGQLKVAKGQCK